MKIGIIREGKTPPDKRVPFTPRQCAEAMKRWPEVDWVVQPSSIRSFSDEEYSRLGIALQEDLSDCDVLFGVKEVPIDQLIPEKTYFFFSHTFKKQPYNRALLQVILEKKIRLIDYEVMTRADGRRIIGFGRYAGIVGTYNAFLAWGKKTGSYDLKPAHQCVDRREMEGQFEHIVLPERFKLVITGAGRVAHGAMEVLDGVGLEKVTPGAFLAETFDHPVYTQLLVTDYNKRKGNRPFTRQDFYRDPTGYESDFMRFARVADVYVPCHYWDHRSPYIFTREDAKSPGFNIRVVADISCDIDCAVASTLRPSTIADPLYGYDPESETEVNFMEEKAIGVMAVDNLPCELPRDASEDFGRELLEQVLPAFLGDDPENIMGRATQTTKEGLLTGDYRYLQDWVDGKED